MASWTAVSEGPIRSVDLYESVLARFGPVLLAAVLLLPLVLWDYIRLTNRFAGPVLRLRRTMRQVTAGEQVQPITFRDGDFWSDFAEDFNELLDKVQVALDAQSNDGVNISRTDATSDDPALSAV